MSSESSGSGLFTARAPWRSSSAGFFSAIQAIWHQFGTGCFGSRPVGTLVSDLRMNAELFNGGTGRRETNRLDLVSAAQLATRKENRVSGEPHCAVPDCF